MSEVIKMSDVIYQSSDLAQRRVEFLDAARAGCARLRDKDGISLVMLRESRLHLLETLAAWHTAHLRLETLLRRTSRPSVADLGDLAWLRAFDEDDLHEFLDELHDCLVAAHADNSTQVLEEAVHAWRTTAQQLADPLRRSVLLGHKAEADFVVAEDPTAPPEPTASAGPEVPAKSSTCLEPEPDALSDARD